jgi:L-asparaginase
MKNILIIHTGGTFGMSPVLPSMTLKPGNIKADIEKYLPVLKDIAHIHFNIPFNLDSSNISPDEWLKIYSIIKREQDHYDGFVIIHGTDTLVYTAAALSYLLTGLRKPIILTGSQRPLSAIRSDARGNLINAVELATYPIPEVTICFGNKLLRGNRTKKLSMESYAGFESPNYPELASIGLNVQLHPHNFLNSERRPVFKPVFNCAVIMIGIYPGLAPDLYRFIIKSTVRSIVLLGYGVGNFPDLDPGWLDFIAQVLAAGKLVFIGSQSVHGQVDLQIYEFGKQAEKLGCISLRDITTEAALVKLMLLMGNFEDQNMIRKYFDQSLAGELGEN